MQRFAARQMWLSRDKLNRIERGEMAVPFFAGLLFCKLTDLNPLFLAFGNSEKRFGFFAFRGADLHRDLNEHPGATFLEILNKHRRDFHIFALGHARDRELNESPESLRLFRALYVLEPPADEKTKCAMYSVLQDVLDPSVDRQDQEELIRHLQGEGVQHPIKGTRNPSLIRHISKQLLTIQPVSETVESMRRKEWPQLRERIQKLVRRRGMKSALAREIGVSRQAINALLSRKGTRGPSAEYALRLSKWVEIAEAQQKQSAGVSEAPARKTPKKQIH